jgi:hypothetical protein
MYFGFQESDEIADTVRSYRVQVMLGGSFPQNHPYFAEEKGGLKDCINGSLRQENITILISETFYKNS